MAKPVEAAVGSAARATRTRGKGDLASCRATLYSYLSQALSLPSEPFLAALDSGSAAEALAEAVAGLTVAHRAALERNVDTAKPSPEEYTRLFASDLVCPHYEVDYVLDEPFRIVHVLSDLLSFYRTFGVRVADGAGERPDVIGVELEFMGFLAAKEAHATQQGTAPQVKLCRRAQQKFFTEHVGRWARRYGAALAAASEEIFYRQVAELLQRFMTVEATYLGVALTEVEAELRDATGSG